MARVAAGLSQIQAAKLVGKSRQTVNSWEREDENAASPDDADLDILAEAYDTTRAALRYGLDGSLIKAAYAVREGEPSYSQSLPRHARNLPLAVREYLAEFQLRLTKGGATEDEIEEAMDLLRSPQLFTFYKGGAPSEYNEEDVLRGIKGIAEGVIIPELRERGRKVK